jgi:hypothetical protein
MIQQRRLGEPTRLQRRYELDWLRVLAFGLLIFYHIGMYYVSNWGFHIKSQHQSERLQIIMLWSSQWRMSLLFKLSNLGRFWPLIDKQVGSVFMILGVPIALLSLNGHLLFDRYPPSNDFINDYFNHGRYFMAFVMGIVFVRAPSYWQAIRRWRSPLLIAAVLSYTCVLFNFLGGKFGTGGLAQSLMDLAWSSNGWLWILAICGWAQHLLNKDNAVIRYLNGGVYCYYIPHQTLIIALAYHVAPFNLGPVLEPIYLIVFTLMACLGGYELLRRIPGLRMFFGISVSRKPTPASQEILRVPS